MVEQNNEFYYRKKIQSSWQEDTRSDCFTCSLDPSSSLCPFPCFIRFNIIHSFLFQIFLFSIILIFVSQVHHKFSNSCEEIKFDDVIFTEKFRCLFCTPQSMNAFPSTTLVIKALCEMIIIEMAQKTLEKILV